MHASYAPKSKHSWCQNASKPQGREVLDSSHRMNAKVGTSLMPSSIKTGQARRDRQHVKTYVCKYKYIYIYMLSVCIDIIYREREFHVDGHEPSRVCKDVSVSNLFIRSHVLRMCAYVAMSF